MAENGITAVSKTAVVGSIPTAQRSRKATANLKKVAKAATARRKRQNLRRPKAQAAYHPRQKQIHYFEVIYLLLKMRLELEVF